ncbi:MAG: hypothetical protein V4525_17375 [Pseudomonadota bacterium]
MALFSGLSGLAGSFHDSFHDISHIGLTTRMGDSLFSNGHHDSGHHFGDSHVVESITSWTMANSLGDYNPG